MNQCTHPRVSVVIASNRYSPVLDLLVQQVQQSNCTNYECILALNGSGVDAQPTPRENVRVVRERQAGVSVARNTALTSCTGELILFLDDDVRLEPGWLHRLIEPFTHANVWCVTGRLQPAGTPYINVERYYTSGMMSRWSLSRADADWVHRALNTDVGFGCNMAFRKSFLLEHPFPVELGAGSLVGSGEETYMFLQSIYRGGTLVHTPDAVVEHVFPEELAPSMDRVAALYAGALVTRLKLVFEEPEIRWEMLKHLGSRTRRMLSLTFVTKQRAISWNTLTRKQQLGSIWRGLCLFWKLRRAPRKLAQVHGR